MQVYGSGIGFRASARLFVRRFAQGTAPAFLELRDIQAITMHFSGEQK
jgi:hypothetical protein